MKGETHRSDPRFNMPVERTAYGVRSRTRYGQKI